MVGVTPRGASVTAATTVAPPVLLVAKEATVADADAEDKGEGVIEAARNTDESRAETTADATGGIRLLASIGCASDVDEEPMPGARSRR